MSEIATAAETMSAPEPVSTETLRSLIARARAAARAFKRPDEPLGWSDALDAAPWPKGAPAVFETDFRRAFAEGLLKRGLAVEQKRLVEAGPERVGRAAPRTRASSSSKRRLVPGTDEEFAAQDRRAAAEGLSWAAWARRKLAEPD